jgi:protein-L-isoaspartate(D-aspartate) O-methyltransferase
MRMLRFTSPLLRAGPREVTMRVLHFTSLLLILALTTACGEPDVRSHPGPEVAGAEVGGAGSPTAEERDTAGAGVLRREMVRWQIEARGIRDTAVLRAMRTVPRHRFVPGAPLPQAYGDYPLPISHSQTISQPYMVAFMAEAGEISREDRVLEIGTGSGYGAAVLAELAREVYTVEIIPELAEAARVALGELGYGNVQVRTGNGWLGWPEHAPYDAIVVTAAPDEVPPVLVEQLSQGGTLVVPVGEMFQTLQVLRKTPEGLEEVASLPVRFVPMVRERPDTGR